MALWVVVCPRCRQAKVCQAGQKTTTCGHCSRTLQLAELRKHVTTDSPEEAQRAAGLLNARLSGRLEAFLEEAVPPAPAAPRGDEAARLQRIARGLGAEGAFDAPAFAAALAREGLAHEPEDALARLVAEGVLFEPRPGRFALVP